MGSLTLPKPLLAALLIVATFAAVWMVALRPHGQVAPASPTAAPRPTARPTASQTATTPATNAPLAPDTLTARAAVAAHAASQAQAAHRQHTDAARSVPHHARPVRHAAPKVRVLRVGETAKVVDAALRSGKVLALLLFNPAGADDHADIRALGQVSDHGGRVVKLAAPISSVASLSAVTADVQVTTSPTLLVVDRRHAATQITGFVDPLEYAQAVTAALGAGH